MPITTAPVSGRGAPEDIATPEDSALTRHRRHDGLDTDGMAAWSEIFAEEAGPEAVPPCTLEVKIYGPKAEYPKSPRLKGLSIVSNRLSNVIYSAGWRRSGTICWRAAAMTASF